MSGNLFRPFFMRQKSRSFDNRKTCLVRHSSNHLPRTLDRKDAILLAPNEQHRHFDLRMQDIEPRNETVVNPEQIFEEAAIGMVGAQPARHEQIHIFVVDHSLVEKEADIAKPAAHQRGRAERRLEKRAAPPSPECPLQLGYDTGKMSRNFRVYGDDSVDPRCIRYGQHPGKGSACIVAYHGVSGELHSVGKGANALDMSVEGKIGVAAPAAFSHAGSVKRIARVMRLEHRQQLAEARLVKWPAMQQDQRRSASGNGVGKFNIFVRECQGFSHFALFPFVPDRRFGGAASWRHYPEGKKIVMDTILQDESIFGVHLRRARLEKKISQEELAEFAGISPRHMSFLETGRSRPGRDVVLRLGDALELSASERNALLRLAGFAPAFAHDDLGQSGRLLALDAVSKLLDAQGGIPAVASDSLGNILEMNDAAIRFFNFSRENPVTAGDNLFEFFFSDTELRSSVVNWHEIAPALLHHLEQEALIAPNQVEARRLVARIRRLAGPGVEPASAELPIFRFEIQNDGRQLAFISNYSTFGAPYDATMQSIRIECFFPASPESRSFLQTLNAESDAESLDLPDARSTAT